MITIIVIGCFSSVLLVVVTQNYAKGYELSSDRVDSVNFLTSGSSYFPIMVTATDRSYFVTSYMPVVWRPNHRSVFWSAKNPIIPFKILSALNSESIIYLTTNGLDPDTKYLGAKYPESYVYSHLLDVSNLLYNNSEVEVTEVSAIAPPVLESDVILVTSNPVETSTFYAYEILSMANINYTTCLLDDINTLRKGEIIIAPDEEIALTLAEYKSKYGLSFSKLVVLNLEGYSDLSTLLFNQSILNVSVNSSTNGDAIVDMQSSNCFSISSNVTRSEQLLVSDDNSSSVWVASVYGAGNISMPVLSDDSSMIVSGNDSLKITVEDGNYAYWYISNELSDSVTIGDYDFFSFYFFGDGSGDGYYVRLYDENKSERYIIYRFNLNWTGWKRVILPLNAVDGEWDFEGVHFTKEAVGELAVVSAIDVSAKGDNPNDLGVFYMDNFSFEKKLTVNISVAFSNNPDGVQIRNFNSTDFVLISSLGTENNLQTLDQYFLESGIDLTKLFADYGNASYSYQNQQLQLTVSLPPTTNSSMHIQLDSIYSELYSQQIIFEGTTSSTIELVENVSLASLNTNYDVLAYYQTTNDMIPFVVKSESNGFNLVYFNVYPLISHVENVETGSNDLFSQLPELIQNANIFSSTYNWTDDELNLKDIMVAFRPSTFEGNISISSQSAILFSDSTNLFANDSKLELTGPIKITALNASNFQITSSEATFGEGQDFYANITTTSAEIVIVGNPAIITVSQNSTSEEIIQSDVIRIETNSSSLLIRQPSVSVIGNGTLNEFHAQGNFTIPRRYYTVEFYGYDLDFNGHISFTLDYSDTFNICHNFALEGNFTIDLTVDAFNDLEMLTYVIPLALPFSVLLFVGYKLKSKHFKKGD